MDYRRIIPNSISGTNLILGVLSIFESVAGRLPVILTWRQFILSFPLPLMPATDVRQGLWALPVSSALSLIRCAMFVPSALRLR